MRIKTLLAGQALVCLLALQASCAEQPIVRTHEVVEKQPVIVAVPAQLTQPVAVPQLADKPTNADVAHYVLILRQALADANAKLKAIAGIDVKP